MIGLGYRREMTDWDMSAITCDFFEVVPENWVHRDRSRLHQLRMSGRPVYLHGVSLNLGGHSPLHPQFLRELRGLIDELGCPFYSDHLAASGDAHQLYDLFPIPFTATEARRVAERIDAVQQTLGMPMAVENSTWYTNVGDVSEADFLMQVVERANCRILLDLNNIVVNHKNHAASLGVMDLPTFVRHIDLGRVNYLHVAGHEFDARFDMYIDTHSERVESPTAALARQLQASHGLPILLEWDNDIPDASVLNAELASLRPAITAAPTAVPA